MKNCANKKCIDTRPPMNEYDHDGPNRVVHDGCNWLDWMVEDGKCPHCGGPVTEITTVTPLGRLMDSLVEPRE